MQRKEKQFRKRNSLALKLFCALLVFVVVPMYFTVLFVRDRYEAYFKDELSANITSTLAKSEAEIEKAFDNLANMANIFCINTDLQRALQDDALSYYQKVLVFDTVVRDIELNNLSLTENVQITMLDVKGNVYSNWPLDFNDYSFLSQQEWFTSEMTRKGHIAWDFFTDPYIYGDQPENKYIGLSRGILGITTGEHLGTIRISIRQSELSKTLERYAYAPDDIILVCSENGQILMQHSRKEQPQTDLNRFVSNQITGTSTTAQVQHIGESDYLMCHYEITKKWIAGQRTVYVYHFTDYSAVSNRVNQIAYVVNTVLIACLVAVILLVAALAWTMVRPIKALSGTMAHYELEKNYAFVASRRRDEIGQLNTAFRDMDSRMKDLFRQLEVENKIKEQYKLDFLRAQLNPHFLFNTLGTVRWMAIAQNMPNIVECIDALGNMLRYSMNKGEEMVTLQEELENLNSYIKIQNYRYGNQYSIEDAIPQELHRCMLLRFILQPVIENAVLHAFADRQGQGHIRVSAEIKEQTLMIAVEDDGKGIDPQMLAELNRLQRQETNGQAATEQACEDGARGFNKIGVRNVDEQIKIRYGKAYGLRYESDGTHGTRVLYRLPLLEKGEQV